jgi:hypothetical protein
MESTMERAVAVVSHTSEHLIVSFFDVVVYEDHGGMDVVRHEKKEMHLVLSINNPTRSTFMKFEGGEVQIVTPNIAR